LDCADQAAGFMPASKDIKKSALAMPSWRREINDTNEESARV
jgi:hypothetical protein